MGRRRVDGRRSEPGRKDPRKLKAFMEATTLVGARGLSGSPTSSLTTGRKTSEGDRLGSLMGEPTAPEGRFGKFGGRFVPGRFPACEELNLAFREAWGDPDFRGELDGLLRDYAGRPSPLTSATTSSRDSACECC